jgi:hypothetical protein
MRCSNAKEKYCDIWNQHREGKGVTEIAKEVGWTEKQVGTIINHFAFYEENFVKQQGLGIELYLPRELMKRLAELGYRGKLQHVQEIDITKL